MVTVIQRTNDAWTNLHNLRELKRKTGCSYTRGLINRDKGSYYQAANSQIITIREYDQLDNIFNEQQYFKNKYKKYYTIGHDMNTDRPYLKEYVDIYRHDTKDSTSIEETIYNNIKLWTDLRDSALKRYNKLIKQLERIERSNQHVF